MEIIDELRNKKGFIAALDQSGGSSKRTLANYGIGEELITSDEVMFDYIHKMRSRVITNEAFNDRILGVILFENTMERDIDGINTVKYLENKGIPSFLKIDVGLEDEDGGMQMLKEIPNLNERLEKAKSYGIVGTKMRSVIKEYNEYGIKKLIEQQFSLAKIIIAHGLIPIIEPEVDINAPEKEKCEEILKEEIKNRLNTWNSEDKIMFKFTIPTVANHYLDLYDYDCVVRIVALSGGYDIDTAVELLSKNNRMIASFSRALLQDLNANQSQEEFDKKLNDVIVKIYDASIS